MSASFNTVPGALHTVWECHSYRWEMWCSMSVDLVFFWHMYVPPSVRHLCPSCTSSRCFPWHELRSEIFHQLSSNRKPIRNRPLASVFFMYAPFIYWIDYTVMHFVLAVQFTLHSVELSSHSVQSNSVHTAYSRDLSMGDIARKGKTQVQWAEKKNCELGLRHRRRWKEDGKAKGEQDGKESVWACIV
jgi:hypothetical protein